MKYSTNYTQARADFEALERIAELSDQQELDAQRLELMQEPTRARAARMYCMGIDLWFREHSAKVVADDRRDVVPIMCRYAIGLHTGSDE